MSKKITVDTETQSLDDIADSTLTFADIENAAAKALTNFGMPGFIMTPAAFGWHANPQYTGLPWADTSRMTKREHAFAKLHVFLYKSKVIKNLSEEEHETIRNIAIKRLKRAKWSRSR